MGKGSRGSCRRGGRQLGCFVNGGRAGILGSVRYTKGGKIAKGDVTWYTRSTKGLEIENTTTHRKLLPSQHKTYLNKRNTTRLLKKRQGRGGVYGTVMRVPRKHYCAVFWGHGSIEAVLIAAELEWLVFKRENSALKKRKTEVT